MDQGLLSGLATGLKSAVDTAQEQVRYNDEQATKKKQTALAEARLMAESKENGYETSYDDNTKSYTLIPTKQKQLQTQHEIGKYDAMSPQSVRARQNTRALLDQVQPGSGSKLIAEDMSAAEIEAQAKDGLLGRHISGVYQSQGLAARSGLIGAQTDKTKAEADKAKAETTKINKAAVTGTPLQPDKVLQVTEGGQILKALPDLESTIDNNSDSFGPVKGMIGRANPYDEKAKTIDAQMRMQSQAFGRRMEGGVLRKEDEEKYRKMFPQLSDTPEVAKNKLALVKRMLAEKQSSDINALKSAGYSVEGLEIPQDIPSVPSIINPDQKGLIESAPQLPDAQSIQVGYIEAGYEYMGGDPNSPASWRKVQ